MSAYGAAIMDSGIHDLEMFSLRSTAASSGACVKTHRPWLVEEQIPIAANSAQEWRLTQSSDLTSTSLDTTLLHSNKFCLERESRAAVASRAQPSRYLGRRKPSLQFSVTQRFHTGSLLSVDFVDGCNIPKAAVDGSGVVRLAWAIKYVRYLRCCGHFRRAEIGRKCTG